MPPKRGPFIAPSSANKVAKPNATATISTPVRKIANLFTEDDDDELDQVTSLPPKRKFTTLSDDENDEPIKAKSIANQEDDEEVDPLDAFMDVIKKEPILSAPRARRDDIEEEDNMESFLKKREAEINSDQTESSLSLYDQDIDPDDDSYLDHIRSNQIIQKKNIQPLPMVYHSEIDYAPFRKNFYREHESVAALTPHMVLDIRKRLDVHVSGTDIPKPVATFEQMNLGSKLNKAISKQNFTAPTPIQQQALPVALSGRDIIGIAKTGSGKTASFVWPLLIHILDQPPLHKGDGPIGVIIAPTRELAQQIYAETKKFARGFKYRVCPIYGGVPKAQQVKELKAGCEILVCTPGRLIDIIKMKKITNMRRVTFLVFDEADKMFNMGFEPQVRSIANSVRPDRQTLLFSATFKKKVEKVARDILTDPVRITIGVVGEANADVNQQVHVLRDDSEKWGWLVSRLAGFEQLGNVLLFVSTKNASEQLSDNLNKSGFHTIALHGDKLQMERDELMIQFKTQKVKIMVATDVVARGLDIKTIKTVVNFDIAKDMDSHIHRIGRTCRAGDRDGIAYTLITPKNSAFAVQLVKNLKAANQFIPPELVEVAKLDAQKNSKSRIRGVGATRGPGAPTSNLPHSGFDHGAGHRPPSGPRGSLASSFVSGKHSDDDY